MDEASAALLEALVEHLPRVPWLMIATRHTPRRERRRSIRIELGPLSARRRVRARRGDALRGRAAAAHDRARRRARSRQPRVPRRPARSRRGRLGRAAGEHRGGGERADRRARPRRPRADPPRRACSGCSSAPRRLRHVLEPDAAEPDERTWARLSAHVDRRRRRLSALPQPDPLRGRLHRTAVRAAPRAARGGRRGARARPRHRRRRGPGGALAALQPRRGPRSRVALRGAGRRAGARALRRGRRGAAVPARRSTRIAAPRSPTPSSRACGSHSARC